MGLLWGARAENSWMKIVKDEIKEARYGQIGKLRPFFSPVGKYLDSLLCKAGSHSFCLFVFVFVFFTKAVCDKCFINIYPTGCLDSLVLGERIEVHRSIRRKADESR